MAILVRTTPLRPYGMEQPSADERGDAVTRSGPAAPGPARPAPSARPPAPAETERRSASAARAPAQTVRMRRRSRPAIPPRRGHSRSGCPATRLRGERPPGRPGIRWRPIARVPAWRRGRRGSNSSARLATVASSIAMRAPAPLTAAIFQIRAGMRGGAGVVVLKPWRDRWPSGARRQGSGVPSRSRFRPLVSIRNSQVTRAPSIEVPARM